MARWGNVTRVLSEMHVQIFAMKALKRRRPNAVITTESSRISIFWTGILPLHIKTFYRPVKHH